MEPPSRRAVPLPPSQDPELKAKLLSDVVANAPPTHLELETGRKAIIAAAAAAAKAAEEAAAAATLSAAADAAKAKKAAEDKAARRKQKPHKKPQTPEEKEANKEKRLLKLVGEVVVKCMSKHSKAMDHNSFKKHAKEVRS